MAKLFQLGDPREWLDLKAITQYASLSERTIREWLHRPVNPLPAVQVGKKILIRRATFDQWLEAHPFQPVVAIDISKMADEIFQDLRKAS